MTRIFLVSLSTLLGGLVACAATPGSYEHSAGAAEAVGSLDPPAPRVEGTPQKIENYGRKKYGLGGISTPSNAWGNFMTCFTVEPGVACGETRTISQHESKQVSGSVSLSAFGIGVTVSQGTVVGTTTSVTITAGECESCWATVCYPTRVQEYTVDGGYAGTWTETEVSFGAVQHYPKTCIPNDTCPGCAGDEGGGTGADDPADPPDPGDGDDGAGGTGAPDEPGDGGDDGAGAADPGGAPAAAGGAPGDEDGPWFGDEDEMAARVYTASLPEGVFLSAVSPETLCNAYTRMRSIQEDGGGAFTEIRFADSDGEEWVFDLRADPNPLACL